MNPDTGVKPPLRCSSLLRLFVVGVLALSALANLVPAWAAVGDLDAGFGSGGSLQFEDDGVLTALPDGRLQLVQIREGAVRVQRLDADGHADSSFGTAGVLDSPLDSRTGRLYSAVTVSDGSTYVLAYFAGTPKSDLVVARVDPDGRIDASFGSGGKALLTSAATRTTYISVLGMSASDDAGLFVAVSYYYNLSYDDDCPSATRIYKLTATGIRDPAFGDGGEVSGDGQCLDWGAAMVPQPGGGVYLAPSPDLLLDAHGQQQQLPATWQRWLNEHQQYSILQRGQFVFTTSRDIRTSATRSILLTRWRRDLTPDTSFGESGSGKVDMDLGALPGQPVHVISEGAPVLAEAGPYLYLQFAVETQPLSLGALRPQLTVIARLRLDGSLDTSFGTGGYVWSALLPLKPMLQQSDGSLLARIGQIRVVRVMGTAASAPGAVGVSSPCGAIAEERSGKLLVYVEREMGRSGAVSLRFSTRPGSALAGADYGDVSGALNWEDGETAPKTIEIPIANDTLVEESEQFELDLEVSSGGALLNCPVVPITLWSDDSISAPGAKQVSANPPSDEGGGGAIDLAAIALLGWLLLAKGVVNSGQGYSRSLRR